jgi:hypothetical protein
MTILDAEKTPTDRTCYECKNLDFGQAPVGFCKASWAYDVDRRMAKIDFKANWAPGCTSFAKE